MTDREPKDRITHLLKLASKATSRAMQDRLAKHGVSYGHWTFLRILWHTDEITITELAQLAGVAKPAAVTSVKAMEKLGYTTRKKKFGNQKSVYITLTPFGRSLEELLLPLAIEVNDSALQGISHDREKELKEILSRIIENF